MKKLWLKFLIVVLSIFAGNVQAGTVTAEKMTFIDYFNSNGWVSTVQARSTSQWPNWLGYEGEVSFDQVIEAGIMLYSCNPAFQDGCTILDPNVHRFIFSGPPTPEFPFFSTAPTTVKIFDKIVNGQFRRTWLFNHVEDAIQTAAHYPFADFTSTNNGPVAPVGFEVWFHLADVDIIDAMLAGQFGAPLAHRHTLPCQPLREVNGVVFSTICSLGP